MSNVQTVLTPLISFGSSLTADFTLDFNEDGGIIAAVNPTVGNSVGFWLVGSQDIIAAVLRNITNDTVTTLIHGYTSPSGTNQEYWYANDIGAGITDINVTLAADGNCQFAMIEDTQALTIEDMVDYAPSPEGFATVHSHAYTAVTADEIAFAYGANAQNTNPSTSGTNRLINTDGDFGRFYYKEITSSGAGQIDITVAAVSDHNATLVTLSRATGGLLPPVPPNLDDNDVSAVSPTQINIAYGQSTDDVAVTRVDIESSATGIGGWTVLASDIPNLASNIYNDTTLNPSETRHYRIRAFDGDGNDAFGTSGSDTTPTDTTNPVPGNVTAVVPTSGSETSSLNVTYGASTDNVGITNITLERSLDEIIWNEVASGLNEAGGNIDDPGLQPGDTWFYRIRAYDTSGNNSFGTSLSGTTDDVPATIAATVTPGSVAAQNSVVTDKIKGTLYDIVDQSALTDPETAGNSALVTGSPVILNSGVLLPDTAYFWHTKQVSSINGSTDADSNIEHTPFTTLADVTVANFTVAYADLNILSPFAGVSAFQDIIIGDSCRFAPDTTPGAFVLAMSGDGVFTYTGDIPVDQTFSYAIDDGVIGAAAVMSIAAAVPVLTLPTGTETGQTTASGTVTTNSDNGTLFSYASVNASESDANITALGQSQAVSTVGVQNVSVVGLNPGTQYYYHYLHRDVVGDSVSVASAPFTTQAAVAPNLSGQQITNTTKTTADAQVNTDLLSDGTLFSLISTNPSESDVNIKAGDSQAITGSNPQVVSASGLAPDTIYYYFFLQTSDLAVDSAQVRTSGVATLPLAPPVLSNPTGVATGTTTADGEVTSDSPSDGTLFYLASVNAVESVATVKAGSSQAAGTNPQQVSVTGLTAATDYYMHYVQTNGDGDSLVATSPQFQTQFAVAVLSNPTQPVAPFTTLTASIDTDQGGGTLFYLVDVNPTALAAAIKAGDSKAVNAVGTQNITKTGLNTLTQYYVHYIQVTSGDSNIVDSLPVTTGDVLPVPPTSTLNDAILIVTGGPTINDGLAIWYNKQMNEALSDAEYRFLILNGATPRTINDMWYELLTPTYGAGSLNDMQLQYWLNGGVF